VDVVERVLIAVRAIEMKTKTFFILLSVVASASVACAESNEGTTVPPDKITTDTGVIEVSVVDTAVADTTADTGAVQDTMVSDALERCVYPATETKPCGGCGTQTRFCLPEGVWTGFTACAGELADPGCKIGAKRTSECGKCGKATDFCDAKTCTWISGLCTGEGPCEVDAVEATPASCPVAGEVRKRTCDSKCQWSEYSDCALGRGWLPMASPPSSMLGRQRHTAVWTGTSMIVWGGYNGVPTTTALEYQSDGAAYDLGSNAWKLLPSSVLTGRREHMAVWTGTSMIVWGGNAAGTIVDDGASFDPSTNRWTPIADSPLTARSLAAIGWSAATGEVLIWGGCGTSSCSTVFADGAAYKPSTNTWTKLPAAPIAGRGDMAYGMINGELVVTGGENAAGTGQPDGARFDPVTRFWTKFPAPSTTTWSTRTDYGWFNTGTSLVMYGGRTSTTTSTHLGGTLVYTPGVGFTTFGTPTDTDYAPSAKRWLPVIWQGGGKLYAFSGQPVSASDPAGGFVSYDTATGTWVAESTAGLPKSRLHASVVWTGREAIVWGGGVDELSSLSSAVYFNDGAVFRP